MSLSILLRWPDELALEHNKLVGSDQIAALWRCDYYREAELALTTRLAVDSNDLDNLVLLALCAQSLNRTRQHSALLQKLVSRFPDHEMVRWLPNETLVALIRF